MSLPVMGLAILVSVLTGVISGLFAGLARGAHEPGGCLAERMRNRMR